MIYDLLIVFSPFFMTAPLEMVTGSSIDHFKDLLNDLLNRYYKY